MAIFEMSLPSELIKDFQTIYRDSDKIFGEMTKAGAEVVMENMKSSAPQPVRPYIRMSKQYRTPSDGGINTKVYVSGYMPFSTPGRKYFSRSGANGAVYRTNKGVPAEFVANIYEYGRSGYPFPKHPFLRKSFKKDQIEKAMLTAQKKASGGILE